MISMKLTVVINVVDLSDAKGLIEYIKNGININDLASWKVEEGITGSELTRELVKALPEASKYGFTKKQEEAIRKDERRIISEQEANFRKEVAKAKRTDILTNKEREELRKANAKAAGAGAINLDRK